MSTRFTFSLKRSVLFKKRMKAVFLNHLELQMSAKSARDSSIRFSLPSRSVWSYSESATTKMTAVTESKQLWAMMPEAPATNECAFGTLRSYTWRGFPPSRTTGSATTASSSVRRCRLNRTSRATLHTSDSPRRAAVASRVSEARADTQWRAPTSEASERMAEAPAIVTAPGDSTIECTSPPRASTRRRRARRAKVGAAGDVMDTDSASEDTEHDADPTAPAKNSRTREAGTSLDGPVTRSHNLAASETSHAVASRAIDCEHSLLASSQHGAPDGFAVRAPAMRASASSWDRSAASATRRPWNVNELPASASRLSASLTPTSAEQTTVSPRRRLPASTYTPPAPSTR
mmetsp:Transcript_14436/g.45393  ORF Transcript_14436/g.45393 Transcript_14436/m.45393 type:complete len:347 (-) Transcript_14436:1014-2054(-)